MKNNILKATLCFITIMSLCFITQGQNTIYFTVNINNTCGSATDYHGGGWVVDEGVTPNNPYCLPGVQILSDPFNHNDYVHFSCSVPYDVDIKRYRVHITVWEDGDPHCIGTAISTDLYTSDELYDGSSVGTINVTLQ